MWDKIVFGFDVEEETANFGTRGMAICNSAIFETNTIAVIMNQTQDERNISNEALRVKLTKYSNVKSGVVVVVNECVILFDDFCTELKYHYSFNGFVDCIALSQNVNHCNLSQQKFMFVGLSNGDLHCLHLESNQQIFLRNFPKKWENKTFANIFISQEDHLWQLLIVCFSGDIYHLKQLNLMDLEDACRVIDEEQISAVVSTINVDDLSCTNIKRHESDDMSYVVSVQEVHKDGLYLLLLLTQIGTKQGLQLWSPNEGFIDSQLLPSTIHLIKIEVSVNGSFIFGLTNEHTLILICMHTLMPVSHWTQNSISDFVVMNDEDGSILWFTNEPTGQLQLITVPGFETKFKLDVNKVSFLASGQSSLDELFYLEAYYKTDDDITDDADGKQLNVLHVKSVSESQPEYRLERILKRGKFEKAEEFAKLFNLNIEIVYKSEVQHLMNHIQPWIDSEFPLQERGLKLLDLLKKIQDVEFIGTCALNAITSDFAILKSFLLYSEERIKAASTDDKVGNKQKLTELLYRIKDVLLRLNTFLIVEEKPLSAEKWLLFCKADLSNICQQRLKQGELRQAMLIWSRHKHHLKETLTHEQALYFLRIIPPWITSVQILEWLQMFLPTCLVLFPSVISDIVVWCKEKINLMQLRSEENWPECGINFLKKLLKIISTENNAHMCKVSCKIFGTSSSSVKDVLNIISVLTEISMIKKDHSVNVSLSEYMQSSNQDIVFMLLDKVPSERLKCFVNQFLEKFMIRRGLNSDLVISEYILALVDGSFDWWYWEEAPWESRVTILLTCILNTQERMACILWVLKHAPVPWSATITNICEESMKIKSPLTVQIREQKKMVSCKLVLKKYDLKHNVFTKPYIRRALLYIFAQARTSMLEDALQIANTFDDDMQLEVYNLFIQHLIEKGETEKALAFLDNDNISIMTVMHCCENIILRVHSLSKVPVFYDYYVKYVDILDCVSGKLHRAASKLVANGEPANSVISPAIPVQLKNIYNLQNCYQIQASPKNLCHNGLLPNILKNCLQKILKSLATRPNDIEKESSRINEIASFLNLSQQEIYIEFIHLAISQKQLSIANSLTKCLLKLEEYSRDDAKKMIQLGSRFLQLYISSPETETSLISVTTVHQLIVAGLVYCSPDLLRDGLEISSWCRLLLTNDPNKGTCVSDVGDLFPWSAFTNNAIIRSTLLRLLLSYHFYLENYGIQSVICYKDDNVRRTLKLLNSIEPLEEILKCIAEQEQELVYFKITTNLHWSLFSHLFRNNLPMVDDAVLNQTKKMTGRCVSRLLKKLVSSRHLDFQLSLALLNYFLVDEGSCWISEAVKSYRHDFHKLHAVTELGMSYYQQNQLTEKWYEISKIRKQCLWGKKIMEFGLSYKEAFRDSEFDQKQLLLKLIAAPSVTVPVICKYCKDMKFDYQDGLKMYLKHLLLTWEPEFELINNTTGDKDVVIKPTEKKLAALCREILSLIGNGKELFEMIAVHIWDSINYYHYEVFSLLITLLEEKGVKPEKALFTTYRTILVFLSAYRRISEPQQYEKDMWFQLHPNTQSLPPISKYRLPFQLLSPSRYKSNSDPWKIIKDELNITTYKKWFAVLDALGLDKNMLCTLAINQIASDETINYDSSQGWNIHIRNQKFLADIKSCVGNITNLEMASASLYFVVNHLPPGADQLAAATLCYLQAEQWQEVEKSEKARNGYFKVHKKYLTVSTTHILYVHDLGKPQYIQLVLLPTELIHALYSDSIILHRNTGDLVSFPDINKAVEEIGNLHGINVTQIRLELLEEWLQPENFIRNVSFNDSITMNVDTSTMHSSKVDHDNFIRACYVLETDTARFGAYLAHKVFDNNSDDPKPVIVRLRALYCLYSVFSEEALEHLTNLSINEISKYMTNLLFITELESLGLAYSLQGFMACDKSDLALSLLTRNNVTSVRLATCLCQTFDINTPIVWNNLLSSMMNLNMVAELCEILPSLSANYHLLDCKVFENAWITALTVPLTKAYSSMSEEQETIIEKSIELAYSCPITDRMDMNTVRENCLSIGRQDLADKITFLIA